MDPMGMKSISLRKSTQVFVKCFFWGGSDGVVNPIFKSATIELWKYSCRPWKWIMGTSNKVCILYENNTFRSHFEWNSIFNPVLFRCYLSLGGDYFTQITWKLDKRTWFFELAFHLNSIPQADKNLLLCIFFCRPVSKGQNKHKNTIWPGNCPSVCLVWFVDF